MLKGRSAPQRKRPIFMAKTVLGIIGGSGVYEIPGLENAKWQTVKSPWGEPSDQLLTGTLHGVDLVFLPRHGRGHIQTPELDQLPRQYRRPQAHRRHRRDLGVGLRLAEARNCRPAPS